MIEVLRRLSELKIVAGETEKKLENDGLSITNIQKEQLFNHNIKNIINAVEGLLRNEPSEKHVFRLEKEIPDSYVNINKLKNTPQGELNNNLERLKDLISYFESNYKQL